MSKKTEPAWDMDHPDWFNQEKGREHRIEMPEWSSVIFTNPLIGAAALAALFQAPLVATLALAGAAVVWGGLMFAANKK